MSRASFSLVVGLCFFSQLVFSQVTTGTISGVVKDASGAVIPRATVTLRNMDTGLQRTLPTDSRGRYQAPNLALGNYEVQAEVMGFQTEVRAGIKLTVGREAVVNFVLNPGTVAEKVTVTGEAPLVDTTGSAITGLVDDKEIRDLPLNGRSFDQLVLLQVGALEAKRATEAGGYLGGGAKISISGARPQQNAFLLDGSDVVDPRNTIPGSAAGVFLGVDTIREFRVLSNSYSAQYGRSAGGTITAVTRSGTNDLHGSVFEFLRNSALDARNFFDVDPANPLQRSQPLPFKRNQFGFTLGGPIRRDRSFFFGSYEGLRERLGITRLITVPNALARQGILPGESTPITISPGVKRYLDLYPLPNGKDFGLGTGEYVFSTSRSTAEDFFSIRTDHTFSSDHSLFARYSADDAKRKSPANFPDQFNPTKSRNQYSSVGLDSIVSATTLNAFRFSYNRSRAGEETEYRSKLPAELSFVPGVPFEHGGLLNVTGIASIGNQRTPQGFVYNLFEWADDLTYVRGGHTFKSGLVIKRVRHNKDSTNSAAGLYRFGGLFAFLQGTPNQFLAQVPGKGFERGIRMTLYGFYLQDDFKVRPTLTLNLGLREEFMTSPNEVNGRCSSMPDVMMTAPKVGCPYFETFKNNWAPRFGFAWDTRGNSKLVFRGGFGLFYDQPFPGYWYIGPTQLPPFGAVASYPGVPPFPNAFTSLDLNNLVLSDLRPFNYSGTTYAMQYNLTIQTEIIPGTGITLGYAGSQGRKVVRTGQMNTRIPVLVDGRQFFSASTLRRNTTWENVRVEHTDANSNYNALVASVERRLSHGLQLRASYSFSKIITYADSVFGADFVADGENQTMDPYNPRADRSAAGYSLKHNFVLGYTYSLPFAASGVFGKLLAGWQVSGITSISSGPPFAILSEFGSGNGSTGSSIHERPNLAGSTNDPIEGATAGCPGVAARQKLGGPDLYFDPCAFDVAAQAGFYGNLGRNTVVGPGLTNFDLSLVKNTPIREGIDLQFRAEFFNLFNHSNFSTPSRAAFDSRRARVGGAGRIRSTATSSRQIQFSLKLVF